MILIREGSLRRAVVQFCEHYYRERNHQGLENEIIEPGFSYRDDGEVICRERLGGLLRYYYRMPHEYERFEFPDTTGARERKTTQCRI